MKKLLLICLPVLLTGCSAFNQLVERMQTDTLEYQCDEKPLTVKLNNPRQEVSFVYDTTASQTGHFCVWCTLHRRDLCFLVERRGSDCL